VWKGKYRGQEQYWFLGRFLGTDADIDLEAHDPPEFNAWRWVAPEALPDLIVPFKRAVYEELVAEFRPRI
jgi:putative (di)nucleoside polyphosphate hydrolase